jgi:hypothetical protein
MLQAPPPTLLEGNTVLEYVAFTGVETRTSYPIIDAGGRDRAEVKGLAICLNRDRRMPGNVLLLYYCTDEWRVDRVQLWNRPGGGSVANSTEPIRAHAAQVYEGLGRWIEVCSLNAARAKWWRIWS